MHFPGSCCLIREQHEGVLAEQQIHGCIIQRQGESVIECEVEIRGNEDDDDETLQPTVIETTASVKDGETVVLGASKAPGGSTAMIILLTAKIVK